MGMFSDILDSVRDSLDDAANYLQEESAAALDYLKSETLHAAHRLNGHVNQDTLVTNTSDQTVYAVIQDDSGSFTIEEMGPGSEIAVEAILIKDGEDWKAARVFNGAVLDVKFNLTHSEEGGFTLEGGNLFQDGLNRVFNTVGEIINPQKDYLEFLDMDQFYEGNSYMKGLIDGFTEAQSTNDQAALDTSALNNTNPLAFT